MKNYEILNKFDIIECGKKVGAFYVDPFDGFTLLEKQLDGSFKILDRRFTSDEKTEMESIFKRGRETCLKMIAGQTYAIDSFSNICVMLQVCKIDWDPLEVIF